MAETFNDAPTAARDAGLWDPVCTSPCLSGGHEACPYSPSLTRNPRVQTGNSDRGSLTSKPSHSSFRRGPRPFPAPNRRHKDASRGRPRGPPASRLGAGGTRWTRSRQQGAPTRPARRPWRGQGSQADPGPPPTARGRGAGRGRACCRRAGGGVRGGATPLPWPCFNLFD